MAILITLVIGLLASIIAMEMYSVMPTLTDKLLFIATRRLSGATKGRCLEEWRAQLADIPSPLLRLVHAISLILHANAVLQDDIQGYFSEFNADVEKLLASRKKTSAENRKKIAHARSTFVRIRLRYAIIRLFALLFMPAVGWKFSNLRAFLGLRAKVRQRVQLVKRFEGAVFDGWKFVAAKDTEIGLVIRKIRAEKYKAMIALARNGDYHTRCPVVAAELREKLRAMVNQAAKQDAANQIVQNIKATLGAIKNNPPMNGGAKLSAGE